MSRGRSWGLGSRLPARDAVILDLSTSDRIHDLDMRPRGTVRIEPGVTFAALQARLKAQGLAFHLPSFGGPPDASVLANALERGEGAGAQGDRFGALWDLDVALATGERIATGGDRHGAAAALHARPAGPLLEGLFLRNRASGVVLSGRLALQPTLPYAVSLVAEIGPAEALGPGARDAGAPDRRRARGAERGGPVERRQAPRLARGPPRGRRGVDPARSLGALADAERASSRADEPERCAWSRASSRR